MAVRRDPEQGERCRLDVERPDPAVGEQRHLDLPGIPRQRLVYGVLHHLVPTVVPPALAIRLLNEAGPRAKRSLLPPQRVAGYSAAGLRIVPASPASTIGQADIWADPASGLPLRVEILSRSSPVPALETQFLQVSPWRPDLGVLTPQPCIPVTTSPWITWAPTVMLDQAPTLDNVSTLMCTWGGVIQIVMPGEMTVMVP